MKNANSNFLNITFNKVYKSNFEQELYTNIFASGGTDTTFLEKELNLVSAVACEIVPARARWYKEMYPQTEMVCGDITDPVVFERLVQLHLSRGCTGVKASPVCRDFTLANTKRNPNSKRFHGGRYLHGYHQNAHP